MDSNQNSLRCRIVGNFAYRGVISIELCSECESRLPTWCYARSDNTVDTKFSLYEEKASFATQASFKNSMLGDAPPVVKDFAILQLKEQAREYEHRLKALREENRKKDYKIHKLREKERRRNRPGK